MNTRLFARRFETLASVFLAGFLLVTANAVFADIQIDDSATFSMVRTWTAGGWTLDASNFGTFDPSNSDKLIVALGYRASGTPGYTGVTYNGVAMTEAVQGTTSDNRQTTGIFYLDNPGAAGDLVISTAGNGFGFAVSLLAVSGTAEGVGDTSSAQAHTTSLNVVGAGSLVVAHNAVSGTTIPAAQSPLVQLLSHTITGNNSSSHSSGYVIDPGAGTFAPTFSTAGSAPSISAAEFTVALPAEAIVWSDLEASAITDTGATLSAEMSGNDGEVTAYWAAGTVADPATHVWDGSDGPGAELAGTVSRTASNLTADTLYSYAFYGTNSADDVEAWSAVATFPTALTAGQAPAFTSTAATYNTVTLEWTDNAANETGYILQRAADAAGPFAIIAELDPDTTSHVDYGLTPETTYYYQLAATNSVNGSSTAFADCAISETTLPLPDGVVVLDTAAHGMPRLWSTGGATVTAAQLDAGSPGDSFDPSGSDKLIVAVAYRASGTPGFTGVTYNGVAMTQVVQQICAINRVVTGIFYLDNYTGGPGNVVASTAANGFGIAVSAWAVSGTEAGAGTSSSAQAATTSMTVDAGSLVIAQHGVNDNNRTLTADSPLENLLSHAGGNDAGSFASGYQNDVPAGSYSLAFLGGGSNRSISAAEFTAATIPEPSPTVSTVVASPTSVPADGTSISTITVTLKDADGNPVPDRDVTLANTAGPGMADIAPATPVTTDADGVATFTVSSTTVGTEVFTATDITGDDNIVITQTASVGFSIVSQTSLIPGYTPPAPPAPDAPQTSLAPTTAPPPEPNAQAVPETFETAEPPATVVTGPIRVTEYYLTEGDFAGTTATVALEQDLADDYFILVRGSRAGNGLSTPDNDYARVAAVPGGRGNLAASGTADAIGLQRAAAAFDWEGVVTVVESTVPDSPAGFRLVDAVVTTLSGTSGSQVCAPWGDASRVVPFGGYRGGGAELTGGAANRYQGTSVYVRLTPSGTDTLDWQRDPGGEMLADATMTTFVVEWGADWTVQHAAVAGSPGGDGADAPEAYTTAAIEPVARANTWVWGTGIRVNSGIGTCAESCVVTLGDGVTLNATESTVAVGSEYTDAYSFDVYALTHPGLAVDHRFKPDGDLKGLDIPVAVAPAIAGARFAWLYNGCNGTSSRFPRPRMWSRYTADETITVSRGYDGAQFPAWIQGIDFSALSE